MDELLPLCNSRELADGALAVGFDVVYAGQTCRAFAIRFEGVPQAYLNRCTHVAMELDWQPGRVFDDSGQWLVCASHGAAYRPDTGECAGGPIPGSALAARAVEDWSISCFPSATGWCSGTQPTTSSPCCFE